MPFVTIDNGPMQGCTKMDFGDQWGNGVAILFGVYLVLIPGAVILSFRGYSVVGIALYPILYVLGISFIAPWCGLDAVMKGNVIMMISNMVIVGIFFLCAIINSNPVVLKKWSPIAKLMNTRVGSPQSGLMEQDLFFIGPLNEFASLSVMEVLGFSVVLAWVAICVYARYHDLMYNQYGVE